MKASRVDVAGIRREQIIEAAATIIAEQGLQKLSLSEIEKKAGMSRGQLTYYFPMKEDILLAVFDRLLELMRRRSQTETGENGPCSGDRAAMGSGWARVRHLLGMLILHPPAMAEFHSLQYTFLAQMSYRPDFRQRLAALYEEWRSQMAADIAEELARRSPDPRLSPRTLASLVQAILHGLAIQRNADPSAFDRQEMLDLCLAMLGSYLHLEDRGGPVQDANGFHPGNRKRSLKPAKQQTQE